LAGLGKTELKPFALIDSNVLVYAMVTNYPTKQLHERCLCLLEKGLKGELDYILALNPIVVVESFSAMRKLLSCREAESRISALLRFRSLAFLDISKEACRTSVQWAKEKNVPVNDALIASCSMDNAEVIYTMDEEHFGKLKEYGIKIVNPIKSSF
jgi:predicted nucleic acid-binding protein